MEMREQILSVAQRLLQQRGFNGFSYADIAEEVGIRKASLHHHFSTKAELGVVLIESYTEQINQELQRIHAAHKRADEKLTAYVAVYKSVLSADRICMGGMLASEFATLDTSILLGLRRFFTLNIEWLTEVLTEGKVQQLFTFNGAAADHARLILSSLQGALLIARTIGDKDAFDRTATVLLEDLSRIG